jgi:zinc protease
MDTLGTTDSVAQLEREQIRDYYTRTFPISDLTLAVAGDVEPEQVFERGMRHFGALPRRARRARKIPQEQFFGRSEARRNARAHLDRKQAHLFVGFPGTTLDDADRFSLEVLNCILGGQGGRLFVELRDHRALAYRVGALSVEGIDPGYIVVYLACSPSKLPAAREGIRSELERVVGDGVAEEEVERAITYLIGVHEISLQRRSVVASALAFHEAYGIGFDQHRRYAATMRRVTAADVQRVATEYLRWDLAVSACVEPPPER